MLCKKPLLIFDTKLKAFFIQFMHRGYLLNHHVAKFNEISPLCSFCSTESETYLHLFWDCSVSQMIWATVIQFCKEYVCVRGDVMCKDACCLTSDPHCWSWSQPLSSIIYFNVELVDTLPALKVFLLQLKLVETNVINDVNLIKIWICTTKSGKPSPMILSLILIYNSVFYFQPHLSFYKT